MRAGAVYPGCAANRVEPSEHNCFAFKPGPPRELALQGNILRNYNRLIIARSFTIPC